ncbi:MAG TPA: PIG-L family deacetylase, partial [Candidatus Acidoferrales bacterium]|nr:PIG-L family deacetylase [Candidatus Acidoferrales bacterium]
MNRILVLSPHPDDEAIGCGGTLLEHAEQGDVVKVVYLTSGEKGGHGRTEVETKRLREQEAREAARILGVRHLEFWRAPDGAVRATDGLVRRLQAELRAFSPDNIYVTHERETHPDHRGAARLVRKSVSALNGQRPVVFMFELWTPIQRLDKIVDISSHLENKLRAVRAYRS